MPGHSSRSFRSLLVLLVALFGLAASTGCATREEDAPSQTPGSTAFPMTLTPPAGAPLTLDKRPERIVSLSPSATETLFAVGAGQQVVAVDSASNYPEQVPHTQLSGLTPDPEAIAGHNPDLVVVRADVNNLAAALAKTGIKTLVLPDAKTLDDAYAQFALVGKATGHQAEGDDLARRTRSEVDKLVADAPKPAKPLSYYHELDQTFYTATSATFIGQIYGRFGLTNIADGTDPNASGGYPQLSQERVLQANPDLIFLADSKCCGQNLQTVGARPGWNTLAAVQRGNVFALDDDLASRWSPRLTELVRAVAAAVAKAGK
ncbi:ABC transporter substrate-binding protein [Amycolatopsis anabasis]|uniref:ABC transporter substrate-binding protein n=1 Tax=Amycolatopsis anabasis TaxID=1840409 RepID=UPI00131BA4EB|nr:ABC transporter substrate-binding protein [Amycolatopsis anabasis]